MDLFAEAELDDAPAEVVSAPRRNVVELRPDAPSAPDPQWERCKAWIAAALENDPLSPSDIEAQLIRGDAILWPGEKCAIVTEIITYQSGRKVIQPMAAGGDLEEIERMIGGIEAYGRSQGCSFARIEGRPGWSKRMRAFGYKFQSVLLVKGI